jgi:hypothetical protein
MDLDELLDRLKNTKNFHFNDLLTICKRFFGKPRIGKGSHSYLFKTGSRGDPMLNIQPDEKNKKMARFYQVDQVRQAIEKLKEEGKI